MRNPCRIWAERPTLSGWHGSPQLLDPAPPGSTAGTPAGGGAAGNGPRSTFLAATPRRHTMDPENSSSGSELPGKQRRPVSGLRLQALPPCADPAFPVLHDYFEMVYGPLIGPASTLLARALNRHLADAGGPVTVCPVELSLELGLRASHREPVGKTSPLAKAIDRLAQHRLVTHLGDETLAVVVSVPPITDRSVPKLPRSAQRAHRLFAAASEVSPASPRAAPSGPPVGDQEPGVGSPSTEAE